MDTARTYPWKFAGQQSNLLVKCSAWVRLGRNIWVYQVIGFEGEKRLKALVIRLSCGDLSLGKWQTEVECRPAAELRFHPNLSTISFDNFPASG